MCSIGWRGGVRDHAMRAARAAAGSVAGASARRHRGCTSSGVTQIHRCSHTVEDAEGRPYAAQIHGREASSGLWEAWIEFVAAGGDVSLVTDVETTQPDRRAVQYWAAGLEPRYLEGAFARALRHSSLGQAPQYP